MNQPSRSGRSQWSHLEHDDEIDLLGLLNTLWQAKWLIVCGGLVAAVLVAVYSLFLPNEYQASALLSPAQEGNAGRPSRLSGLAGLAGISLPGGSTVDPTRVAVETLQSRKFLIDFVERRKIAPELVATSGYNQKRGRWEYDKERYDSSARKWVESATPDGWELYGSLRGRLGVSFDERRGLVQASLTSYSPSAASTWLSWLLEDLNRHLMEKDVAEAERSIAYLQQKLQETALTEMRQVFYELIEQQTRTIMLARAKPEYSLATIDPPLEPWNKSAPKRGLMVLGAALFGVIATAIAVFVRQWITTRE